MIKLRVKEIAERQGLNLSQLSRKADIDIRTLRRIYRDPTHPIDTRILDKLATALNVSPHDLLDTSDTV